VSQCPCHSGLAYSECCEGVIAGAPAPSPERLMRSRYTAFATGKVDYLLKSWHPSTRPSTLDLPENTQWFDLQITDASEQGQRGRVSFTARFKENNEWFELVETSDFERQDQHWMYIDGNAEFILLKPGRNDLCLCGSERKWKKCCG
jgi:SEC-C motif-containing protein